MLWGIFIGFALGVFLMCLMFAAGEDDYDDE